MGRNSSIVVLLAGIVLAAGAAAASSTLLMGPSPGLAVNGPVTAPSTTTPSTVPLGASGAVGVPTASATGTPLSMLTGTPGGPGGTGTTTTGIPGPTGTATATGTTGTIGRNGTLGTTGVSGGVTNGTARNGAGTGGTTTPLAPGMVSTTSTAGLTVEQIVSVATTVQPGAGAPAFTVPAGQQLIITDAVITNPNTTPACSAGVSAAGTSVPSPLTNGAPAAPESGTGLLCVPAQTSLSLALTTGLEFSAGQSVQLANTPTETTTGGGPLHYHLRGFLLSVTSAGSAGATSGGSAARGTRAGG